MHFVNLFFLGALLNLAFPPFNLWFAIFLFIYPLVIFLRIPGDAYLESFFIGFIFGLGMFLPGIHWVFISIHEYGQVPMGISISLVILLACYMALFVGLSFLFTKLWIKHREGNFVYIFPIVFVFFEYLRSIILGGFPWFSVYQSQLYSIFSSLFPIIGGLGVTFFIIYFCSCILMLFRMKQKKSMLIWMFGLVVISISLSSIDWTDPLDNSISYSIIQTGIDQSVRLSGTNYNQIEMDNLNKITQESSFSEIIILPEATFILPDEAILNQIASSNSDIIFGAVNRGQVPGYSSNELIALSNESVQTYFKRRLVPFGEYIPLSDYFAGIFNNIRVPIPLIEKGVDAQSFIEIKDIFFAPSICFEDAFYETFFSNQEANIFLNITNDGWFNDSPALSQHISFSQIRAKEFGKPLLRSANTGISGHINHDGSIASKLPIQVQSILRGEVNGTLGKTPFGAFGLLSTLVFILIISITHFLVTKLRILFST